MRWDFNVKVVYPLPSVSHPMPSLVKQLQMMGSPFLFSFFSLVTKNYEKDIEICENLDSNFDAKYEILVDAIFGFSFKGSMREPFKSIVHTIKQSKVKRLISVDIPSGWDVEEGNVSGDGLEADVLCSLTAPKECSKFFKGRHWLGGRFVPKKLAEEFSLNIPQYDSYEQVLLLREESLAKL